MNRYFKRFLLLSIPFLPMTSAFCAQYSIYTEEIAPWNYTQDAKLTGLSVEIVREMLADMKIEDNITVIPWARAYRNTLVGGRSVLFSIARTAYRENLFHWVGPIATEKVYLYKRKGSDLIINSLEQARNVANIIVTREFPEHQYLQNIGFQNLLLTSRVMDNFKMLVGYRGELTAIGEYTAGILLKKAGIPRTKVVRTNIILFKNEIYIALSKDIPLTEVDR